MSDKSSAIINNLPWIIFSHNFDKHIIYWNIKYKINREKNHNINLLENLSILDK